jgi:hypothetical protein
LPSWWEVRWSDPGTGDQLSRGGFTSRWDAAGFVQALDAAIVTNTYLDPRRVQVTLGEFAGTWLDAHPGKRRTGTAASSALFCWPRAVVPADGTRPAHAIDLAGVPLVELRPSLIRLWLPGLQAKTWNGHPLSPATVA